MSQTQSQNTSTIGAWILATRPKTLPAALTPVIVGSAMAYAHQRFALLPAMACLAVALLLQVGVNLANDYFDFTKGVDTEDRLGPVRVTQGGLIPPARVKFSMTMVFVLSLLPGLYLVSIGGWPVVVIGAASIIAALAYSGGPYPLASHGLGDLFVFVFFGLVAWKPPLVPAATALASKSSAHTLAVATALAVALVHAIAPAHSATAFAVAPAHTVTPAGKKIRIFFSHFDALLNPLLVQLAGEIRDFPLQAGSFFGIRVLFGQFASQLQLLLIAIFPKLAGIFKKSLALLVQFVKVFIAQITLIAGRAGPSLGPSGPLTPAIIATASSSAGKRGCAKPDDTNNSHYDNCFTEIVHFHFNTSVNFSV